MRQAFASGGDAGSGAKAIVQTHPIANEVVQPSDGAVIVTIKPTDAGFKSQGCARWVPLEYAPPRLGP